MNVILKMLESPDLALFPLLGLLAFIGGKWIAGRPVLSRWANRCSGAAFLLFMAYGIDKFQPENAVGFLDVAFSGVMAAGLMAGVSRIVLGTGAFLFVQFVEQPRLRMQERARRESWHRQLYSAREPRAVSVEPTMAAPVVEKTKAELMAEAEQEYQELLSLIDGMSCEPDEKAARKLDAERRRFRKIKRALK